MSEVGKRLRSENGWELLQEKRTDMKLYFFERGIPVDLSIIKFVKILRFRLQQKLSRKNPFIFTLNLHQESLNAPYWIWYHRKDEFSLFKNGVSFDTEASSCKSYTRKKVRRARFGKDWWRRAYVVCAWEPQTLNIIKHSLFERTVPREATLFSDRFL